TLPLSICTTCRRSMTRWRWRMVAPKGSGRGSAKPWAASAIRRAWDNERVAGMPATLDRAADTLTPAAARRAGRSARADLVGLGLVLRDGRGTVPVAVLLVGRLQVEHAVGPAAAPVDDRGTVAVDVVEEEEVVTDQLHLVEGLAHRHRRGPVHLLAQL